MPVIAGAVRLVGAACLMWIGIRMLVKARRRAERASEARRVIERETSYGWLFRGLINTRICRPCASDGVPRGSGPLMRRGPLRPPTAASAV